MEDRFHPATVGGHIGQVDGPVVPETDVILPLELVVAQPEGLGRPEERSSSEEPHANPVVGFLRVVSVGDFLFVDPGIGVELVCLKDMFKPPRSIEQASVPDVAASTDTHFFQEQRCGDDCAGGVARLPGDAGVAPC